MKLGPLFALMTRSLVVEWRSNFSHLARLGIAILVFIMLITVREESEWYGSPGKLVLEWLGFSNAFLILLSGCSYFATSITEEKEERILGLLRMTSLNSAAILLGKGASRLISTLVLLVVQVPFFFLVIPLGGVGLNHVLAISIALCAYLLVAASVGIFFSVLWTRAWQSTLSTLFVLGATWFLPAIQLRYAWVDWLGWISVHERIGDIVTADPASLELLSPQVMVHSCGAVALFLLSWLLFDTLRRDEPIEGRGLRLRRFFGGRPRTPGLAISWTAYNHSAWGFPLIVVRLVVYFVVIALFWDAGGGIGSAGDACFVLAYWASFAEFAFIGERIIRPEIRSGTLPTLLMLPMTVGSVLGRRLLGFLPGLLPFACVCVFALFQSRMVKEIFEFYDPELLVFLFFAATIPFVFGVIVTWFSTYMRWGATFAALAVAVAASLIFAGMMYAGGMNSPEVVVTLWDVLFVVAMIVLTFDVRRRVVVLGAVG